MKHEELVAVIQSLQRQVEVQGEAIQNLQIRAEFAKKMLVQIVESQNIPDDLALHLNYIMLKRHATFEQRADVGMFILQSESLYVKERKVPTLQQFHEGLLEKLGIEEAEAEQYPLEISIKLLQENAWMSQEARQAILSNL